VLRGLHYQIGRPQAKLVRVTRGRVFDVVVDLRRDSRTFGRWFGTVLDAERHVMLYAAAGFAHGYLVLSEVAEFQYKCSDYYAPSEERGLSWDDPEVGIEWPLDGLRPQLSDRDSGWPHLAAIPPHDLFGSRP
jgi:dTDP-4-dehydrorhamnose 3,5-epimerase